MDPEKALREMAAAVLRFIAENPGEALSVFIQLAGMRLEIRYRGRHSDVAAQPLALRVGRFERGARVGRQTP